jgi:3-dehydroquinate dehydratase/shikimate dehydrogenase
MPTLVCVPIMADDVAAALRDAEAARDLGADIVEFRVDRIFQGEGDVDGQRDVLRLPAQSPLPCIITCRPTYEGGEYDGDDAARISLFEALGASDTPPAYIDVEYEVFRRSANLRQKVLLSVDHEHQPRDVHTRLILSLHDFDGRPAQLFNLLTQMRTESAPRVLKVAFRARSLRDNLELFDIVAESDRPAIALGMGEFGLMSRVLAPKFGAFLTFASLRETSATAPGQPTVRDLLDLYRFRTISPKTNLYGVVGWPVGHSIGPQVHNAGFEAVGHDGVYMPMPTPEGWESFKATMLTLLYAPGLSLRGCSVTIPHKEHLLRLAREDDSRAWEIDPVCAQVGAANTLVVQPGEPCRVFNSDVDGMLMPLRAERSDALASARCIVLGAGGAARAAIVGLAAAGAEVVVAARAPEKAAAMIADVNMGDAVKVQTLDRLRPRTWDVVINCTPVGMRGGPAEEASPVDPGIFEGASADCIVFDTVYNPIETPLLHDAATAGVRTIDGVRMFVGQAAAQFKAWTGEDAPLQLFARIAHEALASPPQG